MKTWQTPDRKVLVDFAVSVVTFVALGFGLELDPEQSALVAKLAGFVAAYFVRNK